MVLTIAVSLSLVVLVSSNNGFQPYDPSNYQNIYTTLSTNPLIENTPYIQINTAQIPTTTQEKLQPFNIRQILLNRILSSPSLQTILDQNSNGYNSNSFDCNSNPIGKFLGSNYGVVPNYDRLNNDVCTTNKENNESNIETEGKRRKHKRKKNSKPRRQSEDNKHNDTEENNKETGRRSKKRSRRPKPDSSKENQADNNEDSNKNTTKRPRKLKNKENGTNTENNTTENPKPRRRHKKKHKSDANSNDTDNLEQLTPQLKVINDEMNLANHCEGITEECRQTRNSKPEKLDIQKPVTNLVDLPNGFNFNPFQHLYNNPSMTNFLANYENIYKNMLYTNIPANEPRNVNKKKPKNSRKNQRRQPTTNKNSTVPAIDISTPSSLVYLNINETTEESTQVNDTPQANNNFTTEAESLNPVDKPIDENENLLDKDVLDTDSKALEADESFVNDYDGYIDDYYPLFTDNAAYMANNKEIYVKNLGDIKYYYTVDKNNPELPKSYDEIENIGPKEEIVEFRAPPLLEDPDFETKKVEIAKLNPDTYNNKDESPTNTVKSSTYSPAKLLNTEVKKNALQTAEDKNIEMAFAKSKVAKYGTAYNSEENETSFEEANEVKEEFKDSFKDGGMTYVLAKSLNYDAPFW